MESPNPPRAAPPCHGPDLTSNCSGSPNISWAHNYADHIRCRTQTLMAGSDCLSVNNRTSERSNVSRRPSGHASRRRISGVASLNDKELQKLDPSHSLRTSDARRKAKNLTGIAGNRYTNRKSSAGHNREASSLSRMRGPSGSHQLPKHQYSGSRDSPGGLGARLGSFLAAVPSRVAT